MRSPVPRRVSGVADALSHSSRDSRQAIAVKAWLVEQEPGLVEEIFLDLDPHTGIRPGERWKQSLNQANSRCERSGGCAPVWGDENRGLVRLGGWLCSPWPGLTLKRCFGDPVPPCCW
jgi:hypothetical protein